MKVITNITLRIGGGKDLRYAEAGSEVELDKADAEALLALGHVRVANAGKPANLQPSLEDIAEAIEALDAEKDFKDGIPNLKALERILKTSITAAQRDEAWAKVQEDRKAGGQ